MPGHAFTDEHREAKVFTKEMQLARGDRRYRRKVASAKQWQRIIAAKKGPCRVCGALRGIEYHHLLARSQGGDDVAENVVPLCQDCHHGVTAYRERARRLLAASLGDGEYAYLIDKLGESALERLFGVNYR